MKCFGSPLKVYRCKIVLLDETELIQEIKESQKGQDILDIVFKHLDLLETVYFGLRFIDSKGYSCWLDPTKNAIKQVKEVEPITLYFGVKFYASDPCKLREECTRYQFFLQIKQDIQQSRLPVTNELAAQLLSYIIQSELGDYDPKSHQFGYVSEFCWIENQSVDFENRVCDLHKKLIGQIPLAAEMQFLDRVKWLDLYGCELHSVVAEDRHEYFLGLGPHGIIVLKNKLKIGYYYWPRIKKVWQKGKFFMIKVIDKNNEDKTYGFEMLDRIASSRIYKSCKEHKEFFKLSQNNLKSQTRQQLDMLGSSGNSKTPVRILNQDFNRPNPSLVRISSRRFKRTGKPDGSEVPNEDSLKPKNTGLLLESNKSFGRFNSIPTLSQTDYNSPHQTGLKKSESGLFSKSASASPLSVRSAFVARYDYGRINYVSPMKRNHSSSSLRRNRSARSADSDTEFSDYYSRNNPKKYGHGSGSDVNTYISSRSKRRHYVEPRMIEWNDILQRRKDLFPSIPNAKQCSNAVVKNVNKVIYSTNDSDSDSGERRYTTTTSAHNNNHHHHKLKSTNNKRIPTELQKYIFPEPIDPVGFTDSEKKNIQFTKIKTAELKYHPENYKLINRYKTTNERSSHHNNHLTQSHQTNGLDARPYDKTMGVILNCPRYYFDQSSRNPNLVNMNNVSSPRVTFLPSHSTAYYSNNDNNLISYVIFLNCGCGYVWSTMELSVKFNGTTMMETMANVGNQRRKSSIFPQYLRRKSQHRKDSTFASESTNILYPFPFDENIPDLDSYNIHSTNNEENNINKFGWINGVYIRTVLNLFGVMLFLRMGWMTGNAGILASLGIVLVSTLLTICTTLSMSAICTNGEIGTGGIYYMISRSLGAEAGSMIGIIFSLANAVLVSLNLVGAAETVVEILQIFGISLIDSENDARIYATIFLIIVAIIPLIGMDWEAKAMFVLLIILFVALANYIIGTFLHPNEVQISQGYIGLLDWKPQVLSSNLYGQWNSSLAEVFSVFFPSVIGIFAGASMSGDLRDPNAAIPKGTFLAIITTSSVYAVLVIFLGFTVYPYASGNFEEMKNITDLSKLACAQAKNCTYGLVFDYHTVTLSSAYGPLIYAGIFAATISSALGSYVCAPRIFQALCEDKLFPYITYFAKGYGKNNDPRRGYILTFVVALLFTMIGQVNAIAPIISIFFIASFCLVNITCFHASFVASPSFRPTFKYYNKWVSLITGLICVAIMFFLSYISAIITVVLMAIIYFYVYKKGPDVNWGTSTKGHVYNNALFSALRLTHTQDHVNNFRPSILLLTGNPTARIPLVDFANQITSHRSLLIIGHIIPHDIPQEIRLKVVDSIYEWMPKRKIKAFYSLLKAPSLTSGAKTMLQICGLGKKLSPNILMMGYKPSWQDCIKEDLIDYYNIIIMAYQMKMGIIILRIQEGLDYADFCKTSTSMAQALMARAQETNILSEVDEVMLPLEEDDEILDEISEQYQSNQNQKSVTFATHKFITTRELRNELFKKQFEKVKVLIPNDAIEALGQFSRKQKPGPIDIWWLADDGGLTILISYLLNVTYHWDSCHIRVFCLTNENIESIRQSMTKLMKRLRIPYKDLLVISESELEPSEDSKEMFKSFIEKFMARNNESSRNPQVKIKITRSDLSRLEKETNKYLIIRDQLIRNSQSSALVVMTLPLPRLDIAASLYMAWLETITEDMPPFLFVRGQANVLSS